jgi:two-component system, NarL family, sensor histidine kinase DesK
MQLLPKDRELGWTPYLWLVYALGVPFNTVLRHAGPGEWALTLAGMAVFLGLYFRGYWLSGPSLVGVIGAIAALGVLFAPVNFGAAVYFVFAAGFAGTAGPPRFGLGILSALVAVIGIESIVLRLPPYFWAPAAIFSVMIGVVNIHFAQRRKETRQLLMAQEEVERMAKIAERERIARDLHDVLGHTLSVVILKSELAAKVAASDPERAGQEIREVEKIAREALAQVRETVRGYQSHGLRAEVAQATGALQAAGVTVTCEFDAGSVPPAQEGVLALALREAVTNVIRHARATQCEIRLQQADGDWRLEIRDDGCGKLGPEGVGLSGMRHRVEALGGRLQRETAAGTRLVITLPAGPA